MSESTSAPVPTPAALTRTVRELEQHVAASGWDRQLRLFALIRTAEALERDPTLAEQLPADVVLAARHESDHLTAVEQEDLPQTATLEELFNAVTWPPTVDGAAVVVERIVLPPEVEAQLPEDPSQAETWLEHHPQRRDVRLAAAVLRDGSRCCAVRARDVDDDARVAVGPDLVPGLVAGLATTLE